MKQLEKRIMPKDEALAFIQNMRWFANIGKVSWKEVRPGYFQVTASRTAWSYWVEVK